MEELSEKEKDYLLMILYKQDWTEAEICDSIIRKLELNGLSRMKENDCVNEITALTKDKLLFVLGFIGNHDNPIPISYIQCLYDKYGDTYNFETDKCELISENRYWRNGWKDKNGSFTNDFQKYNMIDARLRKGE